MNQAIWQDRPLLLAFGLTLTMILGVNSIMPLIPRMAEEFQVSPATASLLITAFTFPGIVFSPVAGMLADRYGRRAVLLPSLALAVGGALACVLAPSFGWLVFFRFVQGVGSAPLGMLNNTIIADSREGEDLTRGLGYNATVLSLGTALFPTLGGLIGQADWRLVFLLPLIAIFPLLLALHTPLAGKSTQSGGMRRYLDESRKAVTSARVLILFGVTLLTFLMLYGPIVTCFPLLAHTKFEASPSAIGSTMIASSLGAAFMAARLGRLTERFGALRLLLASQVCYIIALSLIPLMPNHLAVALPILIFGCGQGLNIPTVTTLLAREAPAAQRGVIMAVNGTLLRLGQTISPLVFSSLYLAAGARTAFFTGTALAAAMAVTVLALNCRRRPQG